MALQVSNKRVFTFKQDGKDLRLSDIDLTLSPEKVMDHYSSLYPELTSGRVEGPFFNEKNEAEYKFSTIIGSKG